MQSRFDEAVRLPHRTQTAVRKKPILLTNVNYINFHPSPVPRLKNQKREPNYVKFHENSAT